MHAQICAAVTARARGESIRDPAVEPGPLGVTAVVVAGMSFTALAFHVLRVGPARQLLRAPLHRSQVQAQLEQLRLAPKVDAVPGSERTPGA